MGRLFAATLVMLSLTSVAHAGSRHVRDAAAPGIDRAARGGYDYYPGWGREPVRIYGVYPGLIYGGATSPPAGR